jgi:Lon protease-like protein
LPLRDVVLFPHAAMPLLVGRSRSLAAVAAAAEGNRELLLVTQRNPDDQQPAATGLHRVGVVARVQHVTRMPNGTTRILVDAKERVLITRFTVPRDAKSEEGAPRIALPVLATVRSYPLELPNDGLTELAVRIRHTLSLFEEYAGLQRRTPPEIVGVLQSLEDPERVIFGIAAHLQLPLDVRQELLAKPSLAELVDRVAEVLTIRFAARCFRISASSFCRSSSRPFTRNSATTTATNSVNSSCSSPRESCPRPFKRGRRVKFAACASCRRCRRKPRSHAAGSTGLRRCRGTKRVMTFSTSPPHAMCSTRITTDWPKSRNAFSITLRCCRALAWFVDRFSAL